MNITPEKIAEVFEKYTPIANKHGIKLYQRTTEEEIAVVKLWLYLTESGDIHKLVAPTLHPLTSFLQTIKSANICFYHLNSSGEIDFLCWFSEPSGNSIFSGAWISPSVRKSKNLLILSDISYSIVFEFYETIIGLTWQPEILEEHTRIGYQIVGNLQKFLFQDIVWLVQLTKENWENSKPIKAIRRRYLS